MKIANTKHESNSALIGMILGDGYINSHNYLVLRHGGKQLKYVDYKIKYLSNYITYTEPKTSINKLGYTFRYSYIKDRRLKYLKKKIYINNRKSLKKILNRFNEISLAFFYMDDGCLSIRKNKNGITVKSKSIHLNIQNFTFEEAELFKNYLLKKFDLDFHITKDKGHPRLWCNTKNVLKFLDIVKPIVKEFPMFNYKLL